MLIRFHPRSLRNNVLRTLRLIKNWHPYAVERVEGVRRLPFPSPARSLYDTTLQFLHESQSWAADKHAAYQREQLRALFILCNDEVPFYGDRFKHSGHDVRSDDPFGILRSLPFLTRTDIEEQFERLIPQNFPKRKLEYFTTGGSTGIPLRFYLDKEYTNTVRDAFFARMWGWMGYRAYERGAILRGVPIDSDDPRSYFDYNVLENKLAISSYHLTDANAGMFYDLLCEFRPVSLQSYPSALTPIAQFIVDKKLDPIPSLRLILCGSENIYPWQQELMEKAFRCRVFSWYGHSENVLLAGQCERSNEYHIFSEHGVLELIRPDGTVIDGDGEVGEIVGTGFINRAMPFLRYRTGDTASYASGPCPCGRPYRRLQRIDGRLQELIVASDGRYISMTALNMHSNIFDKVRQFQFVQDRRGLVTMKIVRRDSYSEQDSTDIIAALQKKTGASVEFNLEFVADIPLTVRGKHRFLIQNLTLGRGDR